MEYRGRRDPRERPLPQEEAACYPAEAAGEEGDYEMDGEHYSPNRRSKYKAGDQARMLVTVPGEHGALMSDSLVEVEEIVTRRGRDARLRVRSLAGPGYGSRGYLYWVDEEALGEPGGEHYSKNARLRTRAAAKRSRLRAGRRASAGGRQVWFREFDAAIRAEGAEPWELTQAEIHEAYGSGASPTDAARQMLQRKRAAMAPNVGTAERDEIVDSMADTFWASAWAAAMEEAGESVSGDISEQVSDTPEAAERLVEQFVMELERRNEQDLEQLYGRMAQMPGKHYKEPTGDEFGYALAMMGLGHGVSWFDDHPGSKDDLRVPSVEVLADAERDENDDLDVTWAYGQVATS